MRVSVTADERFRFWGDYSAAIFLACHNHRNAAAIQKILAAGLQPSCKLRDACGGVHTPQGWVTKPGLSICAIWAADKDLEAAHEQLRGLGADIKKLTSMAHSIDGGETIQFDIEVPDPNQLELPLADPVQACTS